MATTNTFNNPIISGFNPDPSIVRVGKDYFLATSTFEYFPGLPIYHSRDLIQWKLIGHALTRRSQLSIATPEPGGGIWAPTLRYHEGSFYLATCSFERYRPQHDDRVFPRGFYVKTENIWDEAAWSEPVFFDEAGFDQDLFWDTDGTVYLSTTRRKSKRSPDYQRLGLKDFAIHICKVDLASGRSLSNPVMARDAPSGIAEGSHLLRRGRYYYLFTAEGGTDAHHSELVQRSEAGPLGPWERCPGGPLLKNGTGCEVQATGHADLVEDGEGRWWAVFLGVRPVRKGDGEWEPSVFGRESFLAQVEWIDDWPVINGGAEITLKGTGPDTYLYEDPVAWRDDFSEPKLQLGWYHKNTPIKEDYSLTAQPNRLRLYGGPYNLSSPAHPTMLLRKQKHRSCTWQTRLSFRPPTEHAEAGTVVWWNYLNYSSIGIGRAAAAATEGGEGIEGTDGESSSNKTTARVVRFKSPDGDVVERPLNKEDSDVVFVIKCGDKYELGYREVDADAGDSNDDGNNDGQDGAVEWIGEASNAIMTRGPSVGASFTGTMLGVYSFAHLYGCIAPADFHYAEFRSA